MMDLWFGPDDWPLAGNGWPGDFPRTAVSSSGLLFFLDLAKLGDERCHAGRTDLDSFPGPMCCMLPLGHDTPHMPMSLEVRRTIGPMFIRAMRRAGSADA